MKQASEISLWWFFSGAGYTISQFWFHNGFSLAVSSLNNVHYLIRYNNQLMAVEQYFTNIAAIQNMGVL